MIESERLIITPITMEMIDSLLESDDIFLLRFGYKNEGGEYLNPSPDYLIKIKDEIITHPEYYPLAVDHLIILKEEKAIIGTIYFKYLPVNGTSEIGYGMNPKYEGHGYMSEAVSRMLIYGQGNGIKKVVADTTIGNIKSQNVLKRNGFKLEKIEENIMFFVK